MQNGVAGASSVGMHPDWFENAVLVYGPRKSGTTLLHNLLDGGDELFVYPEEVKLKRLLRDSVEAGNSAAKYRHRSRILLARLPRFDAARYDASWSAATSRGEKLSLKALVRMDVEFVMDAITGAKPPVPKAWCGKEVGGDTGAIVKWWAESFARPKILFIVRDPRMVTRAVLNDRRRKGLRLSFSEIVRETLDPLRVLRNQQSLMQRPEILTVTYETLVARPAETVGRIATFLGLPCGSHMELPSIFGEPVTVRTASQAGVGVFESNARWYDGLTQRERLIVGAVRVASKFIPGTRLNYARLVAGIPARR